MKTAHNAFEKRKAFWAVLCPNGVGRQPHFGGHTWLVICRQGELHRPQLTPALPTFPFYYHSPYLLGSLSTRETFINP
jgi:hypothetical protein